MPEVKQRVGVNGNGKPGDGIDPRAAEFVNYAHRDVMGAEVNVFIARSEAGRELYTAQEEVGEAGVEWSEWLRHNLKFGECWALRYMEFHRRMRRAKGARKDPWNVENLLRLQAVWDEVCEQFK
jgi:hypothetical protein